MDDNKFVKAKDINSRLKASVAKAIDSLKEFGRVMNKMKERGVKVDMEKLELFDSGNPDDPNTWETKCPKREDEQHCVHWYDDEACCACGDNPPHVCEQGCGCGDALEGEIWENSP